MPDALEVVLLAVASWRVWHLLAEDKGPFGLIDRARRYVTNLGSDWQEDGDPVPEGFRQDLQDFIDCPFCFGLWVAIGWTAFYAIWPEGAFWTALPFALNSVVIFANHLLSD